MVDCLRDQPDPTGSSPGFQARLKPRLETRRLAGGISWSHRQSTMDSLSPSTPIFGDSCLYVTLKQPTTVVVQYSMYM